MEHTHQQRIKPACPHCTANHNPDIPCRFADLTLNRLNTQLRASLTVMDRTYAALAKGGR